jgi:hypothetical protein
MASKLPSLTALPDTAAHGLPRTLRIRHSADVHRIGVGCVEIDNSARTDICW